MHRKSRQSLNRLAVVFGGVLAVASPSPAVDTNTWTISYQEVGQLWGTSLESSGLPTYGYDASSIWQHGYDWGFRWSPQYIFSRNADISVTVSFRNGVLVLGGWPVVVDGALLPDFPTLADYSGGTSSSFSMLAPFFERLALDGVRDEEIFDSNTPPLVGWSLSVSNVQSAARFSWRGAPVGVISYPVGHNPASPAGQSGYYVTPETFTRITGQSTPYGIKDFCIILTGAQYNELLDNMRFRVGLRFKSSGGTP